LTKYGLWAPEAGIFLDGIGVLLKRNLIDIELVDDLVDQSKVHGRNSSQ
jgi:hypothetical protein